MAAHTNLTEIDQSLKLLWRNNINPSKVVLGLGFYGRSFALADPSCNRAGCRFSAGGSPGQCTESAGTLSYAEIQRLIAGGAQSQLDSVAGVQTLVYGGNNWVSYDDATTFKMKLDFANNNCLGGTMVWAVSLDDIKGTATSALVGSGSLPNFHVGIVVPDKLAKCHWTSCSANSFLTACPAGYTAATQVLDGCPQPETDPFVYRTFCCPSNDAAKCTFEVDFPNDLLSPALICNPRSCPAGTTLLTTTHYWVYPFQPCTNGGGKVNVCCQNTQATSVIAQCQWTECQGVPGCPSGTNIITRSLTGSGGDEPCLGGMRSLCCPPGPGQLDVNTCRWQQNAYHGTCSVGCPETMVTVAVDSLGAGCTRGAGSFCCAPPEAAVFDTSNPVLRDYQTKIHQYMTSGVCWRPSSLQRRGFGDGAPSNLDMAALLQPVLYEWQRDTGLDADELSLAMSVQQIWDDERQRSGQSGLLPTFQGLAQSAPSANCNSQPVLEIANDMCPIDFPDPPPEVIETPVPPSGSPGELLQDSSGTEYHTRNLCSDARADLFRVSGISYLTRDYPNSVAMNPDRIRQLTDVAAQMYRDSAGSAEHRAHGTEPWWTTTTQASRDIPGLGRVTLRVSRGFVPWGTDVNSILQSPITGYFNPESVRTALSDFITRLADGHSLNSAWIVLLRDGSPIDYSITLDIRPL